MSDKALEALLNYQQADEDGVMVLASRQAIHEVAARLAEADALIRGYGTAGFLERCELWCSKTPPSAASQPNAMSDAAFQRAMREAWQMIDPFRPSGDPGSYARGHYNGICDALRQVKANYDLAMKQEATDRENEDA